MISDQFLLLSTTVLNDTHYKLLYLINNTFIFDNGDRIFILVVHIFLHHLQHSSMAGVL